MKSVVGEGDGHKMKDRTHHRACIGSFRNAGLVGVKRHPFQYSHSRRIGQGLEEKPRSKLHTI